MTIQETTDKYIHDRTAKTIYNSIKEIRDLLYKIDSPLKEVRWEIDNILTDKLLEIGMKYSGSLTTTYHISIEEEKTGVSYYQFLELTDKFKETELYKKAFAHEFAKFWKETEMRLGESNI